MSRNMIEANQNIFERLANFVEKSNVDRPIIQRKRCIKTNQTDKEWLKNLTIINYQLILPNIKTVFCEFDNQAYFVTIGFNELFNINEEIIVEIDDNAGIITAILSDLEVPILKKAQPLEIIDILNKSDDDLIFYNKDEITVFFEPIYIYKIQEDSILQGKDLIRISGLCVLENSDISILNFSNDTKQIFKIIFLEGSKNIPYDNLVYGLVSVSWKYLFLDIYRCIERLFSIFKLEEFYQSLNTQLPFIEFVKNLEDYTGWRPKEDEAIEKLIDCEYLPDICHSLLKDIKNYIYNTEDGQYGKLVYKIRNSIVHFRPATEMIKLDDENWDKLVRVCLLVIEYWYNKYESYLD